MNTLGGVTHRVRDLNRLQEVARILIKHGLGLVVAGIPGLPRADRTFQSTPERALAALDALGPAFVKLGQVLSTRPDIIPAAYCEAFTSLQDDGEPLSFSEVESVINAELGGEWRELLASFDEKPLATASVAQVHRAKLTDGREVVFKVQRPGIKRVIHSDLNILTFLSHRLLVEFPEAKRYDPIGLLREFRTSIAAELDFIVEIDNMRIISRNFEGDERVRIPEVIDALSTDKILCMEFFDGVKLRDAREAGFDMALVGERYLEVSYDMLFVHGFFHGDLHPGNVIILPGSVLGLIDFGMVGRLTEEMRTTVISIMFAAQRGDFRTIARLYYELAVKPGRVDYKDMERDTIEVMEKHWSGATFRDMDMGQFFMDLSNKVGGHGALIPSAYTMFFKGIVTSEGLAKSIIQEVDPIEAIRPYFERMLQERLSQKRLQQDLFYHSITLSSLASRLPVALSQLLEDFDAQRLRFNVRLDPDGSQGRQQERLATRYLLGGLTGVAWLCGTLLVTAGLGVAGWILGVLFYLAGLLGLGVSAWGVWRG